MAELKVPTREADVRALTAGTHLELTGRLVTGRDAAHRWLLESFRDEVAPSLEGTFIYHCGPVVRQEPDGSWRFVAAGPTTSIREEPYQGEVIRRYRLRGAIGKGGMGPKTLAALSEHGAVYLHAVGGAAQVLAAAVRKVERVFMLEEFGVPEALWVLEVDRFPVVVTMDSRGGSLHASVERESRRRFAELVGAAG